MTNNDVKRKLTRKNKESSNSPKGSLSLGSTRLNLACTGRISGGLRKGSYLLLVGKSSSGKTWLGRTLLAEASINPKFDNYRLIHDDIENGALMETARFFGKKLAERLEPPSGTREDPIYSATVEDMYDRLDSLVEEGVPFIYVADSESSLTCKAAEDLYRKNKKAREKNKEEGESYGTAKAKLHANNLHRVVRGLKKTGSILVIVSQTRQRIGFGSQFNPDTRSGGTALKFYAHLEIWMNVKEKIKLPVKGKDRKVGILAQAKIEKNRFTGREGVVEIPIYYSHGIDDVGSCVDYLIEEGRWSVTKGVIVASDFLFSGKREALIRLIEEKNMEKELRECVGETWMEIEAASRIRRKNRYD